MLLLKLRVSFSSRSEHLLSHNITMYNNLILLVCVCNYNYTVSGFLSRIIFMNIRTMYHYLWSFIYNNLILTVKLCNFLNYRENFYKRSLINSQEFYFEKSHYMVSFKDYSFNSPINIVVLLRKKSI